MPLDCTLSAVNEDFPGGPCIENLPSTAGHPGAILAGEVRCHIARGQKKKPETEKAPSASGHLTGSNLRATLPGSSLCGSRGYPQDERREREKTRETSLDRAKSARERERE